jgi:SSS family solute:Na+ symporter
VISLVTWGIAYYPGGVTFLTAFATAWMAPAGLLFAIGFIWRKCTPSAALAGAVCALILESVYVILDLFKIPVGGQPINSYFHLAIVGLGAALIPAIVATFFTKSKYYGDASWTLRQLAEDAQKTGTVSLTDDEKETLKLIRNGYTTMSELVDVTGKAGEKMNFIIEKLDAQRFIYRDALRGAGFWSFEISKKGESVLPAPNEDDQRLLPIGLTALDIETLKLVKKHGKSRSSNLVYENFKDPDEARSIAASIVKLLRREYLDQSGFLKRYIQLNNKGEKLLQQEG